MDQQDALAAVDLGGGVAQDAFVVSAAPGASLSLQKIVIPPGSGTGVHRHPGAVIAIVDSGVLTHHAPVHPSGVRRYRTGEAFVEGAHYLHEAVNDTTEDVVLWVVYVDPPGESVSEAPARTRRGIQHETRSR